MEREVSRGRRELRRAERVVEDFIARVRAAGEAAGEAIAGVSRREPRSNLAALNRLRTEVLAELADGGLDPRAGAELLDYINRLRRRAQGTAKKSATRKSAPAKKSAPASTARKSSAAGKKTAAKKSSVKKASPKRKPPGRTSSPGPAAHVERDAE